MFDQWEAGLRVNYWWKQAECYNRDGKLYDEKCHCCWLSRTFPAFKWMKFSGNKSAADIFRKTTALSCRFLDILTPNWYIYSTLVCLYFFFCSPLSADVFARMQFLTGTHGKTWTKKSTYIVFKVIRSCYNYHAPEHYYSICLTY